MRTRVLSLIAVALMTVAFAAPAAAQRRPDGVGGGGPPAGVGDTGLLNQLSVPAAFVNGTPLVAAPTLSLGCGPAQAPGADGTPSDDVYLDYWLQKSEAQWSAACSTVDTAGTDMAVRVWDPQAYLTIEALADGLVVGSPIYSGAAVAEINSMGGVVYGFTWGQKGAAPLPGDYRITFAVSTAATITAIDDVTGDTEVVPGGHAATLDITLTASGGKKRK